jgi:hypothetical protein
LQKLLRLSDREDNARLNTTELFRDFVVASPLSAVVLPSPGQARRPHDGRRVQGLLRAGIAGGAEAEAEGRGGEGQPEVCGHPLVVQEPEPRGGTDCRLLQHTIQVSNAPRKICPGRTWNELLQVLRKLFPSFKIGKLEKKASQ